MSHIAQNVVDDIAPHIRKLPLAADEIRIEIQIEQLRVVVEHFLEVWHKPFLIGGIPAKATANLVVNAACGHPFAGVQNHIDGFFVVKANAVTQQE